MHTEAASRATEAASYANELASHSTEGLFLDGI